MMNTTNSRAAAAQAVHQVVYQGRQLNRTLDRTLIGWDADDRRLITEMVKGVVRWFWRLEHYANLLLEKSMRRKDRDIFSLLLVGLYQLEFMRIPQHASVSETVNATAQMGKPWARGLTNAIMRKFVRTRSQLDSVCLNEVSRFSHPGWLIDLIRKQWPDDWQNILEANNCRAQITLRVNVQKADPAEYLAQLKSVGIAAQLDPGSPVGIRLNERVNLETLPGIGEGVISVQSTASQLAALSLDLAPGQRVLDACSAPGGKLLHLLEIVPQLDEIVAVDIDEARTGEIVDNLKRAGLSARVLTADASQPADWWDGELFDRILVDAPCSATGVINKHPDIKHHRTPRDIEQGVDRQARLLKALLPLLKGNGKLLYTTCSILAQENDSQIENILRSLANYRCEALSPSLGNSTQFGRQRLQDTTGGEGFYYARVIRQ